MIRLAEITDDELAEAVSMSVKAPDDLNMICKLLSPLM